MTVKLVCLGIGFVIGVVGMGVYICCKSSRELMRKLERWADED